MPAAWAARPAPATPSVAVLLTGCDDVAGVLRVYRTLLPRARVFLYGVDLSPEMMAGAEAAGATARSARPSGRGALVRRMFAEVEADIYILAHGTDAADVCVAPLIVAEIDGGGRDLVTVSRVMDRPRHDFGARLLGGTVDFLFGQGGDAVLSDFKGCSRRFARGYRGGDDLTPAFDLTLHALRLRMPVGEVAALGPPRVQPGDEKPRSLTQWIALLRLIGGLLVEERPRRVFGLLGLAGVAAGIGAALPMLRLHGGHPTLMPGSAWILPFGLVLCGAAAGIAGLWLDPLAKARQKVKRLAYLAIPRRIEPA